MNSRTGLFLVTLCIACLLFIVGLLLGMKFDDLKTDNGQVLLDKNTLDTQSYVVESQFFDVFGNKSCALIGPRLNSLQVDLSDLGKKVTEYESKNIVESDAFYELKRKYFLQELSTLVLTKKLIDQCSSNGMNIIYFYRIDDEESLKQGYALDKLVESKNNVHVFSFDIDFDDNAIASLKSYYNITGSPSVVVNFNDIHSGFISFGELFNYKGQQ